jgi:serine protease inhibitor
MGTTRWHARLVAVALVGALVAAACGDDAAGAGELTSSRARLKPEQQATAPLADALDRFGGELYAAVTSAPATGGRNVALSSYSVASALLLTRAGARNVTREEIDRTLHLGAMDADAGFNAIDQALATRAGTVTTPDGRKVTVQLSTANAVWGQTGYPIEPAFLDVLAEYYGAPLHTVDYRRDTEGARKAINGWVADRTAQKIPELIKQGVLDAMVRVVLTNALYLKAPWAMPFDTRTTTDAPFTRLDGGTVTVRMMRQSETLRYAAGAGWRAVELPYAGDRLAMLVVVPDSGRFVAVERAFAGGTASFASGLQPAPVRLGLPRFTFRTATELKDALRSLGMEQLFDPGRADLSGITSAEPLYVSDVLHEVFLAVTEEGTEAAAATAVVARATAAPAQVQELTVDRPFLFAIRDRDTGAVLLQGRVLDPAQG